MTYYEGVARFCDIHFGERARATAMKMKMKCKLAGLGSSAERGKCIIDRISGKKVKQKSGKHLPPTMIRFEINLASLQLQCGFFIHILILLCFHLLFFITMKVNACLSDFYFTARHHC